MLFSYKSCTVIMKYWIFFLFLRLSAYYAIFLSDFPRIHIILWVILHSTVVICKIIFYNNNWTNSFILLFPFQFEMHTRTRSSQQLIKDMRFWIELIVKTWIGRYITELWAWDQQKNPLALTYYMNLPYEEVWI